MSNFIYARYDSLPEVIQGALATFHKDVYHIPVNQLAHLHTAVTSTVAVDAALNTRVIELVDASLFSIGDEIQFNGGLVLPLIYEIINKVSNTLTLDGFLDADIPIGESVELVETDMGVVGSAGTPITYVLEPPVGTVWYITRIIFTMVHSTAGDLGLFGNQAALTNGVLLRARIGGVYGTFTNWKINADIKKDMFDVEFNTRSGGLGSYGTSGRGSFDKVNTAIKLDGDKGDQLMLVIQDDLSGLNLFELNGQGYIGL